MRRLPGQALRFSFVRLRSQHAASGAGQDDGESCRKSVTKPGAKALSLSSPLLARLKPCPPESFLTKTIPENASYRKAS